MNPTEPQPTPDPNQPPPQQVPPSQFPPPGYPPPGYSYPPPGYVPPGYMPPPGYAPGYPPPGYVPPPVPQMPILQPVAPASGSLVQAWVSVATKPSRQNFAAWAQITTDGWVRGSIATAFALVVLLDAALTLGIYNLVQSINTSINTANPGVVPVGSATIAPTYLISLALVPIFSVGQMLVIPFGQAIFMSPAMGTLRQRYTRALRPWALAQVGMYFVTLVFIAVGVGVGFLIISPQVNAAPSALVGSILGTVGIFFLIGIPAEVYLVAMQVQSGSVGTGMSRWAVFGINLLTGLVLGLAYNIILQPIILIALSQGFGR